MERESLFKDRSFSSVIASAYRVQTDNIGRIIKASWLPVLLYAFFVSTLFSLILHVSGHFENAWIQLAFVPFLILGSIAMEVWAFSRVMSLLNEQPREWNLKRSIFLILNLIVVCFLVEAIAIALAVGIFMLSGEKAEVFFLSHWWLPLLVTLILVLLFLPLYYIAMRYMDQPQLRFYKSFLNAYTRGIRYLGFIFLTMFVCGIIMSILLGVVFLPMGILLLASAASYIGVISGDAADMPNYFIYLFWFVSVITFFTAFYVITYEIIVTYLMYGAIEKQEMDKQSRQTEIETISIGEENNHATENTIH